MGKQKVASQDIFERIHFLFQAAHAVLSSNPSNVNLSRSYCSTLGQIARHQVLRLDPHLKRRICKKCHILLLPGVTCMVRLRKRREKHSVVTCLDCGTVKRFVTRRDYRLWCDNPVFDSVPGVKN